MEHVTATTSTWQGGHDWNMGVFRDIHFHRKYKQLFFFILRGQLAYAVTVSGSGRIIFKAVERLQFLIRAELLFLIYSFCPRGLSCLHFVIRKGILNHCERSKAWNSTHHGRYVFQTTYTDRHTHARTHTRTHTHTHTCTCTCASFVFFCCVVPLVVGWGGVECAVVWCGVNGAKVADQIV